MHIDQTVLISLAFELKNGHEGRGFNQETRQMAQIQRVPKVHVVQIINDHPWNQNPSYKVAYYLKKIDLLGELIAILPHPSPTYPILKHACPSKQPKEI